MPDRSILAWTSKLFSIIRKRKIQKKKLKLKKKKNEKKKKKKNSLIPLTKIHFHAHSIPYIPTLISFSIQELG